MFCFISTGANFAGVFTEIEQSNLASTLIGVIVGWILKSLSDYFSHQSRSAHALNFLCYEISGILALADQAKGWEEKAGATESAEEQERAKSNFEKLIKALKPIKSLETHFAEIARCLKGDELDFAVETVIVYNAARITDPARIPDKEPLERLGKVLGSREILAHAVIWLSNPVDAIGHWRRGKRLIRERNQNFAKRRVLESFGQ